ncbi:DNA internalization-related competence protein ComEC/Rec2 [Pseudomonas sessilinigenes]|uniref:DNA internalization-related competence protein ComEC/Rec2 n=1 Tax=Pseudomonas sessilinigenes TaxID=658629 RepID=A0ABX8MTF1_9PSED|nr:DNA internalization-related competence protein ComEC/Rec2 [Pseudomonas sessilinigenes]AZC23536.1 DNA internalization-related competence protein ComEC/Rec2 [Pseudomonas sessilinigenes]QXH42531.1 DNA internalization-related competence protein ComEC/Rec2 [Pseudomonas sessilinigenes]
MRTGMLGLAAGLLALGFLPALPPAWWLWPMGILALMMLPFRTHPVAFFLFGLAWACTCAQWALDDRLASRLDGQTRWLEGRVVGLPESGTGVVRFEVQDAQARRDRLPRRMRLSWRDGPQVRSGERWRLAVTLRRPAGLLNLQGFDYEAWLLARRIGATGTIKDGQLLAAARGAWRDGLRQRLLAVEAHGRAGGLAALVMGDGSGLAREDWQLLQDTGTVHLMVISGQHISLLAGVVYLAVAGLARHGAWPERWPWLPWACALAFLAALGYGLLAGFDVPVQRSCVMVALVLLWRLRFRHLGTWWPLLLALDAVLLFEPLASLQPGFWLSFAAVAILVFTFAGRLGTWRWWQSWSRAQWLVAIGLLPSLLALGLPISLSGPVANLLAVPWISFLVLPPALLGCLLLPVPYLGEGMLWLAGGLLDGLFRWLEVVARWSPAWMAPLLPWWLWVLSCLGAGLLLLPAGTPLRIFGWPLLLLVAWPPPQRVPYGQAEVWQLDVGQGLSFILRTRERAMLYDAGARSGDFDLGERVVVPTLHRLAIRQLDLMLLSHADNDHAGGALAVQRALPVHLVRSGEPRELPAALQATPCESGVSWQWDGVRFSQWQWAQARDGNQASCVLLVEANGERLLLTGDIDVQAERAFLDSPLGVPVHWLQAPHHGSRTSSSRALLQRLAPGAVLISRGRGNAYGHPHPQVVARYRRQGVIIYDSAEQGALKLQLGAFSKPYSVREQRRFWRAPPAMP